MERTKKSLIAKPIRDRKEIAIDVDGVLLDFNAAFDKATSLCLNKKTIRDKDENGRSSYNLLDVAKCSVEEVQGILSFMLRNGLYETIEPYQGAYEAIEELKKQDFYIHIVTAIPDSAKDMRLRNLKDKLDFVPDEIHCVGMGESKASVLHKIKPDVYIDDRIDYLLSAPSMTHLVWCDQMEKQNFNEDDFPTLVDTRVHSVVEWTNDYLTDINKKLNDYYDNKKPIQMSLRMSF